MIESQTASSGATRILPVECGERPPGAVNGHGGCTGSRNVTGIIKETRLRCIGRLDTINRAPSLGKQHRYNMDQVFLSKVGRLSRFQLNPKRQAPVATRALGGHARRPYTRILIYLNHGVKLLTRPAIDASGTGPSPHEQEYIPAGEALAFLPENPPEGASPV